MKMKRYIYVIMIVVGTFISTSCSNDTESFELDKNENALLLKYYALLRSDKPDGSIALQSNATGIGSKTIRTVSMSQKGGINNKKMTLHSDNNTVINFKNHESNEQLRNLFGKNLILDFLNEGSRNPSDSLYIPEELVVNFSSNILEAGATVNWNADSQNTNGIVVFISYDPLLQPNLEVAWNNQYRISEVFALDEGNGSYIISQQDIDRFPEDSSLNIKITRGAYLLATETEPAFIAFTQVSNDLTVKKE